MLIALLVALLAPPPLQCPPGHTMSTVQTGLLTQRCIGPKGALVGPERQYHPNGILAAEGARRAGALHGRWVYYADSGRRLREEIWVNGTRNGAARTWYASGQRRSEGQYVDGQRDGVWKHFSEEGALTETARYRGKALVQRAVEHPAGTGPEGALRSVIRYANGTVQRTTLVFADGRQVVQPAAEDARRERLRRQVKEKAVLRFIGPAGFQEVLKRGEGLDEALKAQRKSAPRSAP